MTCSGRRASGPHLEAERALCDEDLEAVDGVGAVRVGCGEEVGGVGGIDKVDDICVLTDLIERQSQLVEPTTLSGREFDRWSPCGALRRRFRRPRALVRGRPCPGAPGPPRCSSPAGPPAPARRTARTPNSCASAAARSAVRFQTPTSAAPASRSAQITARALPPAPSTSARMPCTPNPSAAIRARRVGVLGLDGAVGRERERVRRADLPGGRARAGVSSSSAARLCGIVTLAPTKPASASARVVSRNRAGGTGSRW